MDPTWWTNLFKWCGARAKIIINKLKLFGCRITLELILSVLFLITPIILPSFYGGFLNSLSEYAHTNVGYLYGVLLTLCGLLIIYDGLSGGGRKYNILIGLSLLGVVIFPVDFFLIIHDTFALIFFVGNAFTVTYYSLLLTRAKKIAFTIMITLSISLLITNIFNLYIAESIGMFSMSYFMYIRHSLKNKDKYLINLT